MAEVWALYLYIIWTKCIPDHFLFHQILSLYHVVPWSASFSHRAGIKVHFVDHYFIKRYLVTNFSHTCTRSSLDVNHFVEWPLFYQWTESLLLINSKSRIYLFIYIYLFQYHQAILYIGSLDIILAIFLSLQLIPKQPDLCFVLLLIK